MGGTSEILNWVALDGATQHLDMHLLDYIPGYRSLPSTGCAMTFERGWTALHQILATRPDGNMSTGNLHGAQSVYPFNREYIYR